jgi:photosystem II stability/assembly factor-like uncharacterized protein
MSGTTNRLNGVSFTDANTGTVVGAYGTILRTIDGGVNWINQSGITGDWLFGVSFTDANTGTVVGTPGIFRTIDGGITWISQQYSGVPGVLLSVSFTDANNGTAVGEWGGIVRTTDGGETWLTQSSGTNNRNLNSVCFSDANIGTIVAGHPSGSFVNIGTVMATQTSEDVNTGTQEQKVSILRTTDGGSTWTSQISDATYDLYGVSFTDANRGTAVGGSTILHTTNGGVVPVELTSFTAEAMDQKVILRWTTATELNNNGFEIQRKVAESDFATVGFVRGEGTTTNQREYSYIDKDLADGKYFYRLKQVDYNGTYEYSDVIEVDVRSLNEYTLEQNYPNPFNPATTIGYVLREKTNAKLILLNAIGEEVAVLVNGEQDKGFHKIDFNASTLASGVYFYRLQAGSFVQTRKMILLK